MDLLRISKQLRERLAQVNLSILALERVEAARPRGRSRPSKWLADAKAVDLSRGSGQEPAAKVE